MKIVDREFTSSIAELDEVMAYLKRIGAEVRSARKAIVREEHGNYWKDIATISFSHEGDITCHNADFKPSEDEEKAIKQAFVGTRWPTSETIVGRVKAPDVMISDIDPDDVEDAIFEFRNARGDFVMFQKRTKTKTGKAYLPWTYWSDGSWRQLEPEGMLPIWGVEHVHGHDTVFVHEGAKAARFMHRVFNDKGAKWQKLRKDFPWLAEMENAAHVGWIGGALNPSRTDWAQLEAMGVKRVFIVADNDLPGLNAVPAIARELHLPTFLVRFTERWPRSFDLADPWPESLFGMLEGNRVYIGPSFYSTLLDVTWATDIAPPPKGTKPVITLRDVFKRQWTYAENAEVFVCNSFPSMRFSEQQFNKHLSAYSHTHETAKLVYKSAANFVADLVYKPDAKELVTSAKVVSINTHVPTQIRSIKGNPKPFLDFMEHLFKNDDERDHMFKWCATLIARPDIRMSHGVLLVSEKQGMGKTTLGSHILAPLVGETNVSWPSEIDIVQSQFNDWISEKRLIIINEIYSGHSWKAYNNIKSYVTDKDLRVNVKYQKPFVIENWAHFLACSNSLRALKMDENDRRWFYPSLTDRKWGTANFDDFYAWLNAGGLSVIRHWAENYGKYIMPSEPAPMSKAKLDLIDESYTPAQREAGALGRVMSQSTKPIALNTGALEEWLKGRFKANDLGSSGHELRKSARVDGVTQLDERIVINNRPQYVLVNDTLWEKLEGQDKRAVADIVRKNLVRPEDIMEDEL